MLRQWPNFKENIYTEKTSWNIGPKSIYSKLFLCTEEINLLRYFLHFLFIVKCVNNYKFLVKLKKWTTIL